MSTDDTGTSSADATVMPFVRRRVRLEDHAPTTTRNSDDSTPSTPGRHFAFARYTTGLRPVTWSNADAIEIRSTGDLPDTFEEVLDDAVTTLAGVTALPLRHLLPTATDEQVDDRWLNGITIHVVDPAGLLQRLGRRARAIRARGHTETSTDFVSGHYTQAVVTVLHDTDPDIFGRDLRHQLGHALGLAESFTTRALMSAAPDPDVIGYQRHDLNGFTALYTAPPNPRHTNTSICLPTRKMPVRHRGRLTT